MKKILIVSLKAGAGHLKAAQAIEVALKEKYPGEEIKNIDLLDYATILSKEFYDEWYLDIVNAVPKFYAWMYERLDPKSTKWRLVSDRMNAHKFQDFVFDFKPEIIFCTHFVPANLLTFWRKKYHQNYKIITTLTDYEAHPLWVDNEFDLYTVATDEVKKQMIEFGADENKIITTGIPVDKKFAQKFNKKEILQKLTLEDKFTVALLAGAFGTGPMVEIFKELISSISDFQIIAVTGKNEDLRGRLTGIAQSSPKKVKILGFINNMEEIMAASDIAISKAGGLTVSESLAIGLSLIITNPFPGQEEANTKFLEKNLAAFSAQTPAEIVGIIENIIKRPELLRQMAENIQKISKPKAAFAIAELTEKFI